MANGADAGPWSQPHIVLRLSITALLAVIGNFVFVVVWLVQMHGDVNNLKGLAGERNARIEAIDSGGSRALALLAQRMEGFTQQQLAQDKRISDMETSVSSMLRESIANSSKIQSQLDIINLMLKRLDERQDRFNSALDNTYNILNEHMRTTPNKTDKTK